jgi:hypothetical protein
MQIEFNWDNKKIRREKFSINMLLTFNYKERPGRGDNMAYQRQKRIILEGVQSDLKRVYNKALYIDDIDKCYLG